MLRTHHFCEWLRVFCLSTLLFNLMPETAQAQVYTDIHDFDCAVEGCNPQYPELLAQGRDGNLYGTTSAGGTANMGTIFRATPDGAVTVLYNFSGPDGQNPDSGLVLGTDGNLYGTATRGGLNNDGTVFKITPAGQFTKLHDFTNSDATPRGGVVQGKNGSFYGTTCSQFGPWTGYSITAAGKFKHLTNSIPPCPFSGLILGADGKFYGTSQVGGTSSHGTVFSMTAAGGVKIVYSFDYTHGAYVFSPVAQGNDGLLYGTTSGGGASQEGVVFKLSTNGKKLTLLREFNSNSGTDGSGPFAGVVAATDGNFYGATSGGANSGSVPNGNVFGITSSGAYSDIFAFDDVHGTLAEATPMQHTNGKIYGLTVRGGPHLGEQGVIYQVDLGLPNFVSTLTRWGSAGQSVEILGTGLTGATSVQFGSAPASFTVVSDSYMTAEIPADGSSGLITVSTPTGVLISNRSFFVVPTISAISPTSGPVGTRVTITGTGLSGASQVKFGGAKASSYTVNSGTSITATVPAGAKTGKVSVKTEGGSVSSNAVFTVTN
jgi:uncharacterized repeat protein (TIGR03803 family)